MTNLFFVRHAHSVYTPDELERPLSDKGLLDAKRVADCLKSKNIEVAISSPYKRAIQTIKGVADHFHLKIQIEPGLRERKLSKEPVSDFQTAIRKVWEDPEFCFEGGESNMVAQKRGIGAILKILRTYEGKNIVLGTHGNLMVLIMNYFDPQYDFAFWQSLQMPDIYQLTFSGESLAAVKRIWIS
ncbi:histidine phosphatase family protein [Fictibacillus gelatini]|uniref:histidine phosphatase family protein n=1 Tax=Fictibacillus gelatini TaxID=225985 RepID=UPI00042764E3|nr:histidine phosphatase family protein [Fictibacillus gelatini]